MNYPEGRYVPVTKCRRKREIFFAFDFLAQRGMHPVYCTDGGGRYYIARPALPSDPEEIIYERGEQVTRAREEMSD